ncbi:hypothetical protein EUTSA_v10026930mg [Eutrema salsugineum]|uniref:C2H2-type domain-containing protein n=1 Tax=Eutrema salsugineum TaxID=72664 RepID=V4P2H5_EUTSA|nr:uncharacterized protein LOC18028270 [Eutrema salsugineum]ESQ53536.1 hypothetical protein EUTSA_v10026930mg [Eutrema salsugineum]
MSNPEKVDDTEEEREYSDEQWSDDESTMRDIVLALPAALRISSESLGVSSVVEEEEARLNEQAVVAAELVMAAAEEAVMKEKSDGKKKKKRKKVSRPRKTMKLINDDEASGSGKGRETKKPKKKASESTNPPRGPPVCDICGRGFGSWKAVFGHKRTHKGRNYQEIRFLTFPPPPKFSLAEGFMIPGPNSAFVLFTAGGGRSGGIVNRGGGGAPEGEAGRGLGVGLNVDPVEEIDQEVTESGSIAKFDLNKSPPNDAEEDDEAK